MPVPFSNDHRLEVSKMVFESKSFVTEDSIGVMMDTLQFITLFHRVERLLEKRCLSVA